MPNTSRILMFAFSMAFALLLVGALPWFGIGPGRNWLMTIAGTACSALGIAILVQRWRQRLPLIHGYSELSHAARPLSYHLCTLALVIFVFILLVASVFAVLDHP